MAGLSECAVQHAEFVELDDVLEFVEVDGCAGRFQNGTNQHGVRRFLRELTWFDLHT